MTVRPGLVSVVTRLNVGGPAIQVTLLTREFARLGYLTSLVAGRCEDGEGDMSYLAQPGDHVTYVPEMARSLAPLGDLLALWRLYRLMRRERPHIVHTHTAKAGALGRVAAWLAGVPVIVHTFHGNSLSGYFSAPANACARAAERALARITDGICVLCPQQETELAGRLRIAARKKFHVVPLGLDLEPYLELPRPQPAGGCLTVGWLGRLVPVKGIGLLLHVVEESLRRTDRLRFILAGDGPERELVHKAAGRIRGDRLTWLGWQADIKPLLARCDVLIQTSRNEGTPMALIQGMAAGRPFVSTPAGGVVDMVEGPVLRETPSGRWYSNGVLGAPTPEAFAGILTELAERPNLVVEMGLNARNAAASRYGKRRLVEDLNGLYRAALEEKAATGLRRRTA